MKQRLFIFVIVFTAVNLIFVPLLSLYGLRVCPVLSVPGFGFGCYYSGTFIILVNILNLILLFFFRPGPRFRLLAFAASYVFATGCALFLLQYFLHVQHLNSSSRAPEILALASLLLGITQAYGLNWALKTTEDREVTPPNLPSFQRLWFVHVFRTMLPLFVVGAVLIHFLVSQSTGFNNGKTAPLADHDKFIDQTSYVIVFLIAWLILTFTFHFLSERDHVKSVQMHIDHLQRLDFKFKSSLTESWGLWAAIMNQLNAFSKILGERTRLLKTFSRFVTREVAERALHNDFSEAVGMTRDLTVMMTDIRSFTSISEKLSPKDVVLFLNEYFTAMLDVASAHQVSVDKFIGDGILAYVEPENEQANAELENRLGVDAALAMILRLESLNARLADLKLPSVQIGIGLYRGPLVIGLIGSEAKLQHTIIGDTVNRTARLEGLCKDLGVPIVMSDGVWSSLDVRTKNYFRSYGKQSAKGLSEQMEVFGGPVKVAE